MKIKSSSTKAKKTKGATNYGKATACPTYQIKITLDIVKPAVWRRLSVPGNASLSWLRGAIQLAMGWTNSRLHQFEVGGRIFSDPTVNSPGFEGEPEILDESKFFLRDVAPHEKDVLHYEYDFGDCWQHTIVVEKILWPESDPAIIAECMEGKRACPPDDCGGPWGYQDLLKILTNPKHEDHKTMKEWVGRTFDSESFDAARTNAHFRMLKWPRTSEDNLRRALMKRDGVS